MSSWATTINSTSTYSMTSGGLYFSGKLNFTYDDKNKTPKAYTITIEIVGDNSTRYVNVYKGKNDSSITIPATYLGEKNADVYEIRVSRASSDTDCSISGSGTLYTIK